MRRIEARRRNASALAIGILPILGKPAAAIEAGNGVLDDPALRPAR
jgi:hypothetical protein